MADTTNPNNNRFSGIASAGGSTFNLRGTQKQFDTNTRSSNANDFTWQDATRLAQSGNARDPFTAMGETRESIKDSKYNPGGLSGGWTTDDEGNYVYDDGSGNVYSQGEVGFTNEQLDALNQIEDPFTRYAYATEIWAINNGYSDNLGLHDYTSGGILGNLDDEEMRQNVIDDYMTFRSDADEDIYRNYVRELLQYNGEGDYVDYNYAQYMPSWAEIDYDNDDAFHQQFMENEQLSPAEAMMNTDMDSMYSMFGGDYQNNQNITDAVGRYIVNNDFAEDSGFNPFGGYEDIAAVDAFQDNYLPSLFDENGPYTEDDYDQLVKNPDIMWDYIYDDPAAYSYLASKMNPDYTRIDNTNRVEKFVNDYGYGYENRGQ